MADTISLEKAQASIEATSPPFLEQDLLQEVRKIGFVPFILVRAGAHAHRSASFVACKTQNEAGQFVNDVASLPGFGESKLLRGIERALSLEVYEAADLLFSWVNAPAAGLAETVHILRPDGVRVHARYNYPAFGFDCGTGPQGPELRTRMLLDTFHTYAGNDGNNALRFAIMEALAFALSRALGAKQRYGQALQVVEQALGANAYSIHLKACKHTLLLKLDGKPVPPRLEKFVGEDNGYLKQFVCPLPFERFDIGPSGDVLVCCGHWLPTSIGNFIREPVDGVLNSARGAQDPRVDDRRLLQVLQSPRVRNHGPGQPAAPRGPASPAHPQGRRRAELPARRHRRDHVRVRPDLQSFLPVVPDAPHHRKGVGDDRKGPRRGGEAAAAVAEPADPAHQSGRRAVRQPALAQASRAHQRRALP